MPTIYENEGHRRSSMKNYHRAVWRLAAWREDKRCRNPKCQRETHNEPHSDDWKNKATLDHKIARGLGGSDTEENFALLCGKCNCEKSKIEAKLLGVIQSIEAAEKKRKKKLAKV